ncbi:MAG: TlyA family RNA methyltransferase [Candidatus Gracilibacteria bacterium]|nr:TlyA family RNA methyltransferase [Candidatus Gracilibacteria bacterium]
MRLDQYITEKLQITRNKSQAIIKAGNVFINGEKIIKTGFEIKESMEVIINELDETKYVARSAVKLKGFLENVENFKIENFICLDIGSSTGGFCQILLEKNVKKIYAVDVGTSQLHSILRDNSKIISIENTDIRELPKIEGNLDLITCDVSFISLEMILDSIIFQMNKNTISILLFKPQFEVGKKFINKKGVVIDEKISEKKLNDFLQICRDKGLQILKVEKSKLEGENGNKEVFVMIKRK